MASINEVAAQLMEHLCNHDSHGYTQGNRWGNGQIEYVSIDGNDYGLALGDRDCSSAVISAYKSALVGTQYEGVLDGATYTGNMRRVFENSGLFEWHDMSFTAQRGDIYLNEGCHTAMCTHAYGSAEGDILAEFSISETGGIYGSEGDQTGWESHIQNYYDYPWDGILHYIGSGEANGGTHSGGGDSSSNSGNGGSIPDIKYCAYTQGQGGWLPEMINRTDTGGSSDDFAGDGTPITYIAIEMPGWYQAYTEQSGWLEKVYDYNLNDLEYGAAGDGTPITKIRCYYETQDPNSTGWLQIRYAAYTDQNGWLPEMEDTTDTGGSADDFAGDGTAITKFYAYLNRA